MVFELTVTRRLSVGRSTNLLESSMLLNIQQPFPKVENTILVPESPDMVPLTQLHKDVSTLMYFADRQTWPLSLCNCSAYVGSNFFSSCLSGNGCHVTSYYPIIVLDLHYFL